MVKFSIILGATLAVGGTANHLQSKGWSGTNLGQCQGTRSSYHLLLSSHRRLLPPPLLD